MKSTKHIKARMSQRAISQDLVKLVLEYGSLGPNGKVVLNKKTLQALCQELDSLKKSALTALKKGGLVVVEEGETLITTYRLDSYSPRKARA